MSFGSKKTGNTDSSVVTILNQVQTSEMQKIAHVYNIYFYHFKGSPSSTIDFTNVDWTPHLKLYENCKMESANEKHERVTSFKNRFKLESKVKSGFMLKNNSECVHLRLIDIETLSKFYLI